jgi:hypothetical protein
MGVVCSTHEGNEKFEGGDASNKINFRKIACGFLEWVQLAHNYP